MKKQIKEEDKAKISEIELRHGSFNAVQTNTVRSGNLKIREINKSGPYYCWMPKDLALMTPESITIKFKNPKTIEDLTSRTARERRIAINLWEKVHPVEGQEKIFSSQHMHILNLALMRLLGIPNRTRDLALFEDLKVKLQDLGARWHNHDVKECEKSNKLFSVEDCLERFFIDAKAKSKLKEAGLTKEEIDDKEMVEAVMKKILDEQLEESEQQYRYYDIERVRSEFNDELNKVRKADQARDKRGNVIPDSRILDSKEARLFEVFKRKQKEEEEAIREAGELLRKEKGIK